MGGRCADSLLFGIGVGVRCSPLGGPCQGVQPSGWPAWRRTKGLLVVESGESIRDNMELAFPVLQIDVEVGESEEPAELPAGVLALRLEQVCDRSAVGE